MTLPTIPETTPARPTVYPRDLHLAENLSVEQGRLRDDLVEVAKATDPHDGGYEHTETVEAIEYVHGKVVAALQSFAALLNAEAATSEEGGASR